MTTIFYEALPVGHLTLMAIGDWTMTRAGKRAARPFRHR